MSRHPHTLSQKSQEGIESVENMLRAANNELFSQIESGEVPQNAIPLAIEANQRFIEYLDEVQKNIKIDNSVTVQVQDENGSTRIKFKNDVDFAEWLAGRMDK